MRLRCKQGRQRSTANTLSRCRSRRKSSTSSGLQSSTSRQMRQEAVSLMAVSLKNHHRLSLFQSFTFRMAQAYRSELIHAPRFPEIRSKLRCFRCNCSLLPGFFSWKYFLNPETFLQVIGCTDCKPVLQNFFEGQFPRIDSVGERCHQKCK